MLRRLIKKLLLSREKRVQDTRASCRSLPIELLGYATKQKDLIAPDGCSSDYLTRLREIERKLIAEFKVLNRIPLLAKIIAQYCTDEGYIKELSKNEWWEMGNPNDVYAVGEAISKPLVRAKRVRCCWLSNNIIRALDRDNFPEPILRLIDLENAAVDFIGEGTWAMQKGLKQLRLARNQMRRIASGAFEGLRGLEVLDLSGNQLTQIPLGTFSGLVSLKKIDLSNNLLTEMPPDLLGPNALALLMSEMMPLCLDVVLIIAQYFVLDVREINLKGNPLNPAAENLLRQLKRGIAKRTQNASVEERARLCAIKRARAPWNKR
jgi:hypothetical protein